MQSEINIWSLVKSLLHNNNCVVISGLGGFLVHQKSASIDPISMTINPPNKQITFNSKLNLNDGLLATIIADHLDIKYVDAIKIIDEEVAIFNQTLINNSIFKIDELGSFTLNNSGKLVFEPEKNVNYLLDSFGLNAVKLNTIQESRTTKIIQKIEPVVTVIEENIAISEKEEQVNKLVSKKKSLDVLVPQRKTKNGVLITIVSSVLVLILALNAFIFLNEGSLTPIRNKYNDMNIGLKLESIFETNIIDKNKVDKLELLKLYQLKTDSKPVGFNTQIFENSNSNFQEITTVKIDSLKDSEVENIEIGLYENNEVISTTNNVTYYIIAGAYKSEVKAKNFLLELKNDGFKEADLIINTSSNGKALKYLVTYKKLNDLKRTEIELSTINENENPDAWIYETNQ